MSAGGRSKRTGGAAASRLTMDPAEAQRWRGHGIPDNVRGGDLGINPHFLQPMEAPANTGLQRRLVGQALPRSPRAASARWHFC